MDVTNTLAEKKTIRVRQQDQTAATRHTKAQLWRGSPNQVRTLNTQLGPKLQEIKKCQSSHIKTLSTINANPNIRVTFINLGYF